MNLCTDNNYECLDDNKATPNSVELRMVWEDDVMSRVTFKEEGDEFSSESAGCSLAQNLPVL